MIQEQVLTLAQKIEESYKKIGLYLDDFQLLTNDIERCQEDESDIHNLIKTDEVQFSIVAQFNIGDVAFRNRIINPEQEQINKEFDAIVPRTDDTITDAIEEMLSKLKDN